MKRTLLIFKVRFIFCGFAFENAINEKMKSSTDFQARVHFIFCGFPRQFHKK